MKTFKNDWEEILQPEMKKEYYLKLRSILKQEYSSYTVHPDMNDIFAAFDHTSYSGTRVVILGQDPYHGENQAHGLSFSVKPGVRIPPSLLNIYKELQSDLGISIPSSGYLMEWADRGVLLLNTTLTVRDASPMSHAKLGWETFTDHVIQKLGEKIDPVVFILWGSHARSKTKLIDTAKGHLIIESPHPSPLSASRGFFGSRPFSRTNDFLVSKGFQPIDWRIS
jgi:uracil-DNA glycosylase